jgi:phosphoribosylformimino-5-aminoimidazole carboxamide ribotide isomerase
VTFTASGGIGSVADIRALETARIPRVIVGKALYEHKIRLEELWSPNA